MTQELTCSALAQSIDEPLAGTAGWATTWLLIENRGPWSSHSVRDSLPADLREQLGAAGWNTQFVREFDDRRTSGPMRLWLVSAARASAWVWTTPDSASQLSLVQSLVAGTDLDSGTRVEHPFLLVCTNGKRDACCAVQGRALLESITATTGDDADSGKFQQARSSDDSSARTPKALESTHLGGHRFSPVVVSLPLSYQYRCENAQDAGEILAAAASGSIAEKGARGHTAKQAPEQVVELQLRRRLSQWSASAPWTARTDVAAGIATVAGSFDGRDFHATVTLRRGDLRRESCIAEPKPLTWWELSSLEL